MQYTAVTFQSGLTRKSFVIGLVLLLVNVYWLIQLEVVRYTHLTLIHPLSNVIFIVFWMLLIGQVLSRISARLRLQPRELLTIYVMLCIVSSLCSHDMMEILISSMGHPFRFATPENEWRGLFWRHLPNWLTVQDGAALIAFYEGGTSFYTQKHLQAWFLPVAAWTSFILVLMFVMLCINTLLRVQWTEHERLTYPIIQLPLRMTDAESRFFKNRLMWLGFGIAALISTMNLLNSVYPAVPFLPVKRQVIHQYFTSRPWNMMGHVGVAFYPFAIGISFLIPLNLLFSCWVFFWFYKLEIVLGGMMGWRNIPRFPYANEQGFGAYVGLLGFVLWAGRSHIKRLARHLLSAGASPPRLDDSREPMPYRIAGIGIVMGVAFLTLFSYRAGMSLWVVPIFFGLYFLLGTIIARLRAESGLLVHDLHYIDPHSMMINGFGTRRLGAGNLTVFSLYMFFNRAYRAHPMPHQLEAMKISERRNINPRHMAMAILAATLIGCAAIFWMLLDNYYRHGAETGYYGPWTLWFGRGVYRQLENWLNYPKDTDVLALAFIGGGFGLTALLMYLRARFLWWPLHPLGYAAANPNGGFGGMYNMWCCFFITWVLKAAILRHGGFRAYHRAIPFFLGIALGDYILGHIWSVLSILTNTTLYQFWP